MKKFLILSLPLLFASMISSFSAQAQSPKLLESYKDWAAFTHTVNGNKICFAATKPTSKKANKENISRDPVFFFITREPAENVINEINVTIGYPFKVGSDVIVQIGSDKFDFFTQGDGAWVKNAALESSVLDAIKRGIDMTITGTSQRNTITTDSYSLRGATAAINRIAKECPA